MTTSISHSVCNHAERLPILVAKMRLHSYAIPLCSLRCDEWSRRTGGQVVVVGGGGVRDMLVSLRQALLTCMSPFSLNSLLIGSIAA